MITITTSTTIMITRSMTSTITTSMTIMIMRNMKMITTIMITPKKKAMITTITTMPSTMIMMTMMSMTTRRTVRAKRILTSGWTLRTVPPHSPQLLRPCQRSTLRMPPLTKPMQPKAKLCLPH